MIKEADLGFREGANIEFRADIVNSLNRVRLGRPDPETELTSPSRFGRNFLLARPGGPREHPDGCPDYLLIGLLVPNCFSWPRRRKPPGLFCARTIDTECWFWWLLESERLNSKSLEPAAACLLAPAALFPVGFQSGSKLNPRGDPGMATLTIKNIPDELYRELKRTAEQHRRSLNSEVIVCLERSLQRAGSDASSILARARELRTRTLRPLLNDRRLSVARSIGRR